MLKMSRMLVLLMICAAAPLSADEESPAAPTPDDAVAAVAGGQLQKPTPAPPTPEHTGIKAMMRELVTDVAHLPSYQNLFWAGVGGGMAAAVHPLDSTANANLSGPTLDKVFKPGAILGQSYTLLPVSATVYAI